MTSALFQTNPYFNIRKLLDMLLVMYITKYHKTSVLSSTHKILYWSTILYVISKDTKEIKGSFGGFVFKCLAGNRSYMTCKSQK